MPRKDTIENRVYLFESLARALLERQAADLSSASGARRARVLRALADLASVSCAVSDTGHLDADGVRGAVLDAVGVPARRRSR